ncbi:MAG: hypothetical protein JXR96_31205 [Deltaproteobacteria bacterium]|nr:hypothetical protein [Deltaproteobacteria bacterium]
MSRAWAWRRGSTLGLVLAMLVSTSVQGQELLPGPGGQELGSVFGRVFLDLDADGKFSEGDEGLEGVGLLCESGQRAWTDDQGRYHLFLLSTGREVGGGHVIALDRASLPEGAAPRGTGRKLLRLVAMGVERADFAILPPLRRVPASLCLAQAREKTPGQLTPLAPDRIESWLTGLAPEGCRASLAGREMELDASRAFKLRVDLHPGVNAFPVGLQCEDGRLELLVAEIIWRQRRDGGDLIVPGPYRSLVTCIGPPPGDVPATPRIELACRSRPGVRIEIGGRAAQQGRFVLDVAPGGNRYEIRAYAAGQEPLDYQADWNISSTVFQGALLGSAALSVGLGSDSSVVWGGQLRGQAWAELPGDLKLILGGGMESFNIEGLSASEIAVRALGSQYVPHRFERALDPESCQPAPGDEGRVEDDNPSQSRYLLALAHPLFQLGWGGILVDEAHSGPGTYRRALQGGRLAVQPLRYWVSPDLADMRLEAFYARPDPARTIQADPGSFPAPAHDEFLATGGTLYFLSHARVMEGSERVLAELRDGRTGIPISSRKLRRGVDYEIDWRSGRLILTEPLAAEPLLGAGLRLLAGGVRNAVLSVDYEHLSAEDTDPRDQVAGGRLDLRGRPIGWLDLQGSVAGFGALAETGGDYGLLRTRLQTRIGDWLTLWGAFAASSGQSLVPSYSTDGGLSFSCASMPARDRGEAYEAGAELSAGPVEAGFRFRRWLEGFADTGLLADQDLTQFAGALRAAIVPRALDLDGHFSASRLGDGDLYDGVLAMRYRPIEPLELSLQGSFDASEAPDLGERSAFAERFGEGRRALAGLRAAYRIAPWISVLAGHQHAVYRSGQGWSARDLTLSSLGVQLQMAERFLLGLEGGWGPDLGNLLRLSVQQAREDGSATFAHTTLSPDEGGLRSVSLSAGRAAALPNGWLLSAGQSLEQGRRSAAQGQRVGLELPIADRIRLAVAYERSELEGPQDAERRADLLPAFVDRGLWWSSSPGRRNAVFGRISYLAERLALSAAGEYRIDEHMPLAYDDVIDPRMPSSHRQTVLRLAGRWAPLDGLALGGRLAWGETFGSYNGASGPGVPEGAFLEASLGLAWRPAEIDWLRLFLRSAAGRDQRPDSFGLGLDFRGSEDWWMASAAALFCPARWAQPTLVAAPYLREFRFTDGSQPLRTFGVLSMLRLSSEIWAGLGLAAEGRLAWEEGEETSTELDTRGLRLGAAVEAFYAVEASYGGLRLGVGYSFSDIPDPLLCDLRTGQQGIYVRLEGML